MNNINSVEDFFVSCITFFRLFVVPQVLLLVVFDRRGTQSAKLCVLWSRRVYSAASAIAILAPPSGRIWVIIQSLKV